MNDVIVRANNTGAVVVERRRPGRVADVSPELIALMRAPSASARVRVAMYDAPGFLLREGRTVRQPRSRRYVVRALAATAGLAVVSGVAVQAMIWTLG